MKDFWCRDCELAFSAQDAEKIAETGCCEFWGMRQNTLTFFYHCPTCKEELEDYDFQDSTGEDNE